MNFSLNNMSLINARASPVCCSSEFSFSLTSSFMSSFSKSWRSSSRIVMLLCSFTSFSLSAGCSSADGANSGVTFVSMAADRSASLYIDWIVDAACELSLTGGTLDASIRFDGLQCTNDTTQITCTATNMHHWAFLIWVCMLLNGHVSVWCARYVGQASSTQIFYDANKDHEVVDDTALLKLVIVPNAFVTPSIGLCFTK